MTTDLSDARNFRALDAHLLTAGQPNEEQLADAARQGCAVVINLALHDDPRYSLRDEAGTVRGLGMAYVHIPVQFKAPTEQDFQAFCAAMDAHRGQKILVHCAANYRVTAFVGLYRMIRDGWSSEQAFEPMRSVWEPDDTWKQFIAETLARNAANAPKIEVRPLTLADSGSAASLVTQLGYATSPEQLARRLERLDSDHALFVATVGQQVIGFAGGRIEYGVESDAPYVRVIGLAVDQQFRHRGVGTLLMEQVETWARTVGTSLTMLTSGSHRTDAHSFYERIGYARTGVRFVKQLTVAP